MTKDEPIAMSKLQSISTARFSVISIDGINEQNKSIVGTKLQQQQQQQSPSKNRTKLKLLDPTLCTKGNTTDHPFNLLENNVDPLVHAMAMYTNNNCNTTLKTINVSIGKEKGLIQNTAPALMTDTTIPKTTRINAVTNNFSKNMINETIKEIKNGVVTDNTKDVVSSTTGATTTNSTPRAPATPSADLQTVTTSTSTSATITTSNEVSSQHSATFTISTAVEGGTDVGTAEAKTVQSNVNEPIATDIIKPSDKPCPETTVDTSNTFPVLSSTVTAEACESISTPAGAEMVIKTSNTEVFEVVDSDSFQNDSKEVVDATIAVAKDATAVSVSTTPITVEVVSPKDVPNVVQSIEETCAPALKNNNNKNIQPELSSRSVPTSAAPSTNTAADIVQGFMPSGSSAAVPKTVDTASRIESLSAKAAVFSSVVSPSVSSATKSTDPATPPSSVHQILPSEKHGAIVEKDINTFQDQPQTSAPIVVPPTPPPSIKRILPAENPAVIVEKESVAIEGKPQTSVHSLAPPDTKPIRHSDNPTRIVENDSTLSKEKPQISVPTVGDTTIIHGTVPEIVAKIENDIKANAVDVSSPGVTESRMKSELSIIAKGTDAVSADTKISLTPTRLKRVAKIENGIKENAVDVTSPGVTESRMKSELSNIALTPSSPKHVAKIENGIKENSVDVSSPGVTESRKKLEVSNIAKDTDAVSADTKKSLTPSSPKHVAKIENGIKENSVDVSSPVVTESKENPELSVIAKDTDAFSADTKKSSTPTSTTESDEVVLVSNGSGLDNSNQTISPLKDSPKNDDDDSKTPSTGIVCHCSICVIS